MTDSLTIYKSIKGKIMNQLTENKDYIVSTLNKLSTGQTSRLIEIKVCVANSIYQTIYIHLLVSVTEEELSSLCSDVVNKYFHNHKDYQTIG